MWIEFGNQWINEDDLFRVVFNVARDVVNLHFAPGEGRLPVNWAGETESLERMLDHRMFDAEALPLEDTPWVRIRGEEYLNLNAVSRVEFVLMPHGEEARFFHSGDNFHVGHILNDPDAINAVKDALLRLRH